MHSARNVSPLCTGVTTLTRGFSGTSHLGSGSRSDAVLPGFAIMLAQLDRMGRRRRLVHREVRVGNLVHIPVRRVVVEVQGAAIDAGRTGQGLRLTVVRAVCDLESDAPLEDRRDRALA